MEDKSATEAGKPSKPGEIPPAGPHGKPELTDDEKTPGSGAMPDEDTKEIDPGAG